MLQAKVMPVCYQLWEHHHREEIRSQMELEDGVKCERLIITLEKHTAEYLMMSSDSDIDAHNTLPKTNMYPHAGDERLGEARELHKEHKALLMDYSVAEAC